MGDSTPQVFLIRADVGCSPAKSLSFVEEVKIQLWVRGTLQTRTVKLVRSSGNGLRSSLLGAAISGFHFRTRYKNCVKTGSVNFCEKSDYRLESFGEPITLCHNGPYPFRSLENAALSLVWGMSEASFFFQRFYPSQKLAKLDLLLDAQFENILELPKSNLTLRRSNNAFWTNLGRESTQNSLIFLPDSQHSKEFLWSKPGIAAHEYGHHIFFYLAPGFFPSVQGQTFSLGFEGIEMWVQEPQKQGSHRMVISALNEAFADLIAHYAFDDGDHPDLRGLGFERRPLARDLASSVTEDGQEKVLNREVAQAFFYGETVRTSHPQSPNLQDVHTLGAILAKSVDDLLEEEFWVQSGHKKGTARGQKTIQKGSFVFQWVSDTHNHRVQDMSSGPDVFLKKALGHLLRRLREHGSDLTPGQCAIVENKWPLYAKEFLRETPCSLRARPGG